jgi:hypothetical protein
VSPVVRVLDELKASHSASGGLGQDLDGLVSLIEELHGMCCSGEGSENAAIAVRNGGVEALVALCASAQVAQERLLASALKALSSVLRGMICCPCGLSRCGNVFGNLQHSSIYNLSL